MWSAAYMHNFLLFPGLFLNMQSTEIDTAGYQEIVFSYLLSYICLGIFLCNKSLHIPVAGATAFLNIALNLTHACHWNYCDLKVEGPTRISQNLCPLLLAVQAEG